MASKSSKENELPDGFNQEKPEGEGATSEADLHPSPNSARRQLRLDSWLWFSAALLILATGFLLDVRPEGRVAIWGQSWLLPESCFTKFRLGVPCPGCGLTRSFVYITHGEFAAAWQINWVGCILFAYVCIQLPLSLFHAFTQPEKRQQPGKFRMVIRCNEVAVVGILILLFGRWGFLLPSLFRG